MITREDVLEAMLQQSASTIEFLHECLTNPQFKYAYPEQTLAWLEEIRAAVPERHSCFHSMMVKNCEGCAEGARWREVMASWREDRVLPPWHVRLRVYLAKRDPWW